MKNALISFEFVFGQLMQKEQANLPKLDTIVR